MAAVGQKQLTWCDDTPETQVTVTYCDHLKGLPTKDIVTRSGLVLGAAADCAAWGALVGAATPAPGGAGIGAIIGAVIGATCMGGTITGVDKRRHNADVERYPTEGIEGLNQVLLQAEYEADDLCGILNAVPLQPVRLDGERQVYEFSALRHWVQEHGTSPITMSSSIAYATNG